MGSAIPFTCREEGFHLRRATCAAVSCRRKAESCSARFTKYTRFIDIHRSGHGEPLSPYGRSGSGRLVGRGSLGRVRLRLRSPRLRRRHRGRLPPLRGRCHRKPEQPPGGHLVAKLVVEPVETSRVSTGSTIVPSLERADVHVLRLRRVKAKPISRDSEQRRIPVLPR